MVMPNRVLNAMEEMTNEVRQDEMPTATEFIPMSHDKPWQSGYNRVRYLQATGDGGMEETNYEPYIDEVENRVFVCDQCGHDESNGEDMARHLHHSHVLK